MSESVRLTTWYRKVPLSRPFVTAVRSALEAALVVVTATDSRGTIGAGEAACSWKVTGSSPAGVAAAVAGPLQERVEQIDLESPGLWWPELRASLYGNDAALAAVDMALWDLAARRAGRTLDELVAETAGGRSDVPPTPTREIRTDITVSVPDTVDRLVGEIASFVDEGFDTVKVKVDAGEVARMAIPAVARALPRVRLRVDANQCWDADLAVETLDHWRAAGVDLEFVEQPVAARDLVGLAQVHAAGLYPILADESVRTAADLEVLRGVVEGVNVKLAKAGGVTPALDLALQAQAQGLGVLVGCMLEGEIGIRSARAVAAAVAPGSVHDLDGALWMSSSGLSVEGLPGSEGWEVL